MLPCIILYINLSHTHAYFLRIISTGWVNRYAYFKALEAYCKGSPDDTPWSWEDPAIHTTCGELGRCHQAPYKLPQSWRKVARTRNVAESGVSWCATKKFSCPLESRVTCPELMEPRSPAEVSAVPQRGRTQKGQTSQLQNLPVAFKGGPDVPTPLDCGLSIPPDWAPQGQGCVCSPLLAHPQPRDW